MFQALKEMNTENLQEIIDHKNKYTFDNVTNRFLVQPIESEEVIRLHSESESADADNLNMSLEKLNRDIFEKFSRFGQLISEQLHGGKSSEILSHGKDAP